MNIMSTGRNNNIEGIGGQEEVERSTLITVDEEDGAGGQEAAARSASLVEEKAEVEVEDEDEIHPEPLDCLYGRGKAIYFHPGNIRMLEIVKQYKKEYQKSDRKDKCSLIHDVIEEIRDPSLMIESASEDSGGIRFLAHTNGKWTIASGDDVYKKVRNALRDKKLRKRKQKKTMTAKKRPRTETTTDGDDSNQEGDVNDHHQNETRDGVEEEESSSHYSFHTSSSHSSSSTRESNNSKDKKPAASVVKAATAPPAAYEAIPAMKKKSSAPSPSKNKSVKGDQTGTAMCRGLMTMMRIDEENPPLSYHIGADGINNPPLFTQDIPQQYYCHRYPTNISNGTILRNTAAAAAVAAAASRPFEYAGAFEPLLPLNDGNHYHEMTRGGHHHRHRSYSYPIDSVDRKKTFKGSVTGDIVSRLPQNRQVVRFDYNNTIAAGDDAGDDDCEPLPLSSVDEDDDNNNPYSKAT